MATEASPLLGNASVNAQRLEVNAGCPSADQMNSIVGCDKCEDSLDDDVVSISDTTCVITKPTSNLESMMNLMKGMIGIGILAMPAAMKNAGLWMGFGGLIVITVVACHCMHQLVQCCHYLCKKSGKLVLSYGEVMEEAFKRSRFHRFSSAAKLMVNTFLCMTQFGFCIVYILFIADNLRKVVGESRWPVPVRLYEFFVFLALVPFSFVRDLRYLGRFSLVANLLALSGLVITLQYCVRHLQPTEGAHSLPAFASWNTLPLFFGMAVFALEGIGVVLPIENKMARRADFIGLTGVMNTSLVLVVLLYIAVGFYGYLAFGADVQSSITLNLPDTWLYISVKLMFAVAVFITYGIQFYVPAQIIWPVLKSRITSEFLHRYGDYIMRFTFVTATFAIAVALPHLDLMVSLIGALSSCALALIFPPFLELITFWPDQLGVCRWKLAKNVFIIVFGTAGFLAGTITTLINLVHVL